MTLIHISAQTWWNCVGLYRSRIEVACCLVLVVTEHVWIAAETRITSDSCSVSPTRCRVTRSNPACLVKILQLSSVIQTVGGNMMIQILLRKFVLM